ncbi:conserved exported protein of unknown function [Sterolibacterium denitrificans]|uniref:Dicarboxylate transport domain-containing protein n=1 Tax=Sterolibacterium denitrificans TaxID=157592 RepID=A0A7Z7HSM1_9PROT|nr:hypothetical protein [Sterolibacterium denitrificans]SMB27663.1 conserved exported protein of unknown function [Sterolibacterium denitrificans]
MFRIFRTVLFCLLLTFVLPAQAQQLEVALDAVDHPAFSARRVTLRLAPSGAADLEVGALQLGERKLEALRLHCASFVWSSAQASCRRGELRIAQAAAARTLPVEFTWHTASKRLELQLQQGELGSLAQLLPELAAWHPAGRFTLQARLDASRAEMRVALHDAAFADTAGLHAGDKITANLELTAERRKNAWQWQTRLDWPQGELYVAPLYRAGAMRLAATGSYAPQSWQVEQATLRLDDIGQLAGSMHWQPADGKRPGRLLAAELNTDSLDLATLIPQFVQPFIDARAGMQLAVEGRGQISAAFDAKGLSRADITLAAAKIEAGKHAIQGLEARIPWRRDVATQGHFRVAGGNFGALPLGAFDAALAMRGYEFDVPNIAIPLLDGRLLFENFHAARHGDDEGAWQWRLGAALEPVSMPLLTQALGWPKMSGVLSAAIPQVSYANGTMLLDGQLIVTVFDGYLAVDGLRLIDPFGRLPRLQANIEARHLDLEMLTETFSFGSITGYIDADVKGLEMAGMRPLAFNASILSTPGDYRKRISQRAVQNISSLGGAGAAAAIQRSFLQIFETFGYDSIGLRCRLIGGVCWMAGIDAPPRRIDRLARRLSDPGGDGSLPSQGYELVRGGGIPALNVIGYNRRVDWEELVNRLKGVIAGNHQIEVR